MIQEGLEYHQISSKKVLESKNSTIFVKSSTDFQIIYIYNLVRTYACNSRPNTTQHTCRIEDKRMERAGVSHSAHGYP